MAELAIPLLLLGSAYLYSNENSQENDLEQPPQEGFTNVQNYTVKDENVQLNRDENLVQGSAPMKNYHDKYMNTRDATYNNGSQFKSLTGEVMQSDGMSHNNMTPFYSGNQTGNSLKDSDRMSQSILDNYTGSGSQMIEKEERGMLFQPEENVQNVYGNQNANDFLQSRVNPSMRMANIKPWQEEKVAPGLNLGYTTQGSEIGFNSGFEAQDQWRPKTVDELRTKTNQKETFTLDGHMGPAMHPVHNRGHQGKMIKKLPDRFYANDKDRWFTTTGQVKESTQRSEHILQESNRNDTSVSYFGGKGAGQVQENYVRSNMEETKKQMLPGQPVINLTGCGGSVTNNPASTLGYGKNSYLAYGNNRDTTNKGFFGNMYNNSLLANVLDPVVGMIRPTRKSNHVGNIRESGNVAVSHSKPQLVNPYDKPAVTNREMNSTKLDFNHLNVGRQKDGAYVSTPHDLLETQRMSTNYETFGVAGATQGEGVRLYNAAYNQSFNENKQHISRTNVGNMGLMNPYVNVRQKELDRENNRQMAMHNPSQITDNRVTLGHQDRMPQNYENKNESRLDHSLLEAFKNNPYTKPLGSVA